ncbi:MAG: DegT/DnrJ/EryC1/StrS family aminotransferase [Desulfobacterales bacterium]
MNVPFLDLKAQHNGIRMEIDKAIQQVLDETAFFGGPFVADFEREFADFCGCGHCVGVGSGTEAIWLALKALEVGPGDEVITTPNTCIATVEAISMCGARPIFVDIEEQSYTMDPQRLKDYLQFRNRNAERRKSIKAVIPVHMFGQMADMASIMEIAHSEDLFVVEDACQASGAQFRGRSAGSFGDAGCFSFYPGQNLGAFGEAGAVVTDNMKIAETVAMLRDHGQAAKHHHVRIGWNSRMDGLQGAVLRVKLNYLSIWNEARREKAALYNLLLEDAKNIIRPHECPDARHIYHIYAIRAKNRDRLMSELNERGIQCGIHYPTPVHLTEACKFMGYIEDNFSVTETCAKELISLPMYPDLKNDQIDLVCRELKKMLTAA